jgi:hypothetical protein
MRWFHCRAYSARVARSARTRLARRDHRVRRSAAAGCCLLSAPLRPHFRKVARATSSASRVAAAHVRGASGHAPPARRSEHLPPRRGLRLHDARCAADTRPRASTGAHGERGRVVVRNSRAAGDVRWCQHAAWRRARTAPPERAPASGCLQLLPPLRCLMTTAAARGGREEASVRSTSVLVREVGLNRERERAAPLDTGATCQVRARAPATLAHTAFGAPRGQIVLERAWESEPEPPASGAAAAAQAACRRAAGAACTRKHAACGCSVGGGNVRCRRCAHARRAGVPRSSHAYIIPPTATRAEAACGSPG